MTWTIPVVEDLYQRLFSLALGLNVAGVFKSSETPMQLEGTMTVAETRIFMNDTASIVTIAILCLNVVVVTVLYVQESSPFLPRLPLTIGSLLAYVAASRAVRKYQGPDERDGRAYGERAAEATYSFGKFVGVDGKEHAGVEADPFVSPADAGGMLRFRRLFSRSVKEVGV